MRLIKTFLKRRRYFLNWSTVDEGDTEELNELLVKVMKEVFTDHKWKLELNLQSEGFESGMVGQTCLLRIWEIPDMNSLENVMTSAADNRDYIRINNLVRREVQDFSMSSNVDPSFTNPGFEIPQGMELYITEDLEVKGGSPDMAGFFVGMNEAIAAMSKFGLDLLMATDLVTGAIPRFVNVWGTNQPENLLKAFEVYRNPKSPWADSFQAVIVGWQSGTWKNVSDPTPCVARS